MCKRLTKYTWTLVYCIFTMLNYIFKRIMLVRLRVLMWFLLVFLVLFFLHQMIHSVDETSVTKAASQYPVILWWTMEFPGTSSLKHCPNNVQCHVYSDKKKDQLYEVGAYLFYGTTIDFKALPLPRQPKDIIWGLYHEESPRNVEEFLHESALNLFNFSTTFSRYSNIPFPLQYLHSLEDIKTLKYFVKTSKKNELLKEIAPIMYLQSDCETSSERDTYVKELMKYIKIDSYGTCLKNKEMPAKFQNDYLNNLDEDEFLRFVARYKFIIAIENGVCNDYITEKFWRAIKVGTVPIYFGSPTIKDWLPNEKSAVLLQDYPTPKIMYEHIKLLLSNDSLYEAHLEHKTRQFISNEKVLLEYNTRPYQSDGIKIIDEFECFICQKLHDKMNGKIEVNVVNKSHYDCPKPISALTLDVNPENSWVFSWENAGDNAKKIYKNVFNGD
ncbi:alpha-(1,3)-fucosyltransferase 10 isoform X1 [Helicoverpa armigera]|uniref:alpha-(1,3)-fucosyltransferase 10 isoform X1 n=2 Tax=Helicoverpa armigera TaxID=29058 RepID=UPI003083773E